MDKSGIYIIYNKVSNKFYIGSAVRLQHRRRCHFSELRLNKHANKKFQSSYNKHGNDNFIFDVVEECNKENLISREQYYLDTFKPFYNICKVAGSQLGFKHSKETLSKLSEKLKGRKSWNKGLTGMTYPNRKKRDNSTFEYLKKPIIQLDLKGNFIKRWNCIKDAELILTTNKSKKSHIHQVLNGTRKKSLGFKWKYAN